MKKFFISVVLLVSVCVLSATASEGSKVSPRVQEAFNREFAGAQAVKWETISEQKIYQAHFIYNNERLDAFFDEDGNLIATGRFIVKSNMPFLVTRNIAKRYGQYKVTDVVEYVKGNETSYLVRLESDEAKLVVQAYNTGHSYVFKKEKK